MASKRPADDWVRKGNLLVLYAICVVSVAVIVASHLMPSDFLTSLIAEHAPEITLVLLSLYVVTYLERDRLMPERGRGVDLGLKRIFRGRSDEGQQESYFELLNGAKDELFIVGITLKQLSQDTTKSLCERAAEGTKIDLLMLSPLLSENRAPIVDTVAYAQGRDIKPDFKIAIPNIRWLARQIHKVQGKLAVGFYTTSPTVSLTASDGRTRGRMHVEIVPHQIPGDPFRPILEITNEGKDEIFSEFYDRYRALWKEAEKYVVVEGHKCEVNRELDGKFRSG